MPRKRSKITDGVIVGIRLSTRQHLTYLKLGSTKWLRNYLDDVQDRVDEYRALAAANAEKPPEK